MKKLILIVNIYFLSFPTLITEPPVCSFQNYYWISLPWSEPVEKKVVWNVRCCAELYNFTLH
jgi:hypothetical protein